ncbi:C39 family peptidase [Anaerorhabdus sp.]|uniref:C39 family peptidase n=1 Tax=Anaerorhabdus sp. TaxID=1872524 RepID=UPI002FCB2CF8
MKKIIVCLLALALVAGCSATPNKVESTPTPETKVVTGNYTDEMKIPYAVDLEEYGADSVERNGDHQGSPYFNQLDFYNMESTDTLTILPKFKTYQQTSEWSCGVVSALMVLNFYDALGEYNESTLAEFRTNGLDYAATSLESMIDIFEGVGGFEISSTYDYTEENFEDISLEFIQENIKNNIPMMVAWNDWGGHWQVIIGYDTMGTETTQDDVIIVADSYDTTDHNQDGYGVYPAERFFYNWTMYDFFTENYGINERDRLFITVKPVQK